MIVYNYYRQELYFKISPQQEEVGLDKRSRIWKGQKQVKLMSSTP